MKFTNYKIIKKLNQPQRKPDEWGDFLVELDDGRQAVLKIADDLLIKEAEIMRSIDHPGIPKFIDIDSKDQPVKLLMQRLPGVNLEQFTNMQREWQSTPIDLPTTALIGAKTAQCFAAIHQAGYIYKDFNLTHVMFDEPTKQVGLLDYEAAILASKEGTATNELGRSTWETTSPEEMVDKAKLTPATNVFAIGVLLRQLATGHNPFCTPAEIRNKKISHWDQIYQIKTKPTTKPKTANPKLDSVIVKCLQPKPEDRYKDMGQLISALNEVFSL